MANSRKREFKCCQPKQKTRRKLYRVVFERIKESKWAIYRTYLKHKSYLDIASELDRTFENRYKSHNN